MIRIWPAAKHSAFIKRPGNGWIRSSNGSTGSISINPGAARRFLTQPFAHWAVSNLTEVLKRAAEFKSSTCGANRAAGIVIVDLPICGSASGGYFSELLWQALTKLGHVSRHALLLPSITFHFVSNSNIAFVDIVQMNPNSSKPTNDR